MFEGIIYAMIILPSLVEKTRLRPYRLEIEEQHRVPDIKEHVDFWEKVYDRLLALKFYSPVVRNIAQYINPLFGYFGRCVHPNTHEIGYFHAGVEMEFASSRKIFPVASGILEYSGYGAINGHYVLLSHPQIQTEDGYVLHSMYCHMKKPQVRFSSYQKMLREISLGTYPQIEVHAKQELGTAGNTGVTRDESPRLYLQLDFRKYGEQPIAVDPLLVFNGDHEENATAYIHSKEELAEFIKSIEQYKQEKKKKPRKKKATTPTKTKKA